MGTINTQYDFIGKEVDIQNHIIENIDDICFGLKLPKVTKHAEYYRMKSNVGSGIIDLFILHEDNTATLIEVKKFKDEVQVAAAIGQVIFYGELAKCHLSNYPRLIIASNFIPDSLIAIVKNNKLNIKLLQIDGDIVKCF